MNKNPLVFSFPIPSYVFILSYLIVPGPRIIPFCPTLLHRLHPIPLSHASPPSPLCVTERASFLKPFAVAVQWKLLLSDTLFGGRGESRTGTFPHPVEASTWRYRPALRVGTMVRVQE